jgi:hypothetical protein
MTASGVKIYKSYDETQFRDAHPPRAKASFRRFAPHVLCDNGPFWTIDHGDQLCRAHLAQQISTPSPFLVLRSRTPTPASIFWIRFAKIDDDQPDLSQTLYDTPVSGP